VRCAITVLVLLSALACRRAATPAPAPSSFDAAVGAVTWTLVELEGRHPPIGAGGKSATIEFATGETRAAGFTGCNRFTTGYTVAPGMLRFEGTAMTRMACPDGMELEQFYTKALEATERYEVSGDTLTFLGASGPLLKFKRGR